MFFFNISFMEYVCYINTANLLFFLYGPSKFTNLFP